MTIAQTNERHTLHRREPLMMFFRRVVLPEPVAPNTTDCITRVASGQNQGLPCTS